MRTTVIVNLRAGNGRTGKIWAQMELALTNSIGAFQTKQTSCHGYGAMSATKDFWHFSKKRLKQVVFQDLNE